MAVVEHSFVDNIAFPQLPIPVFFVLCIIPDVVVLPAPVVGPFAML